MIIGKIKIEINLGGCLFKLKSSFLIIQLNFLSSIIFIHLGCCSSGIPVFAIEGVV